MRKIILLFTIISILSLTACTNISGNENSSEISTTSCDYTIIMDSDELSDDNTVVNVSINILFKKDVVFTLPTSSYGKAGIVELNAVKEDDVSISLYNNRYGVITNEQLYIVKFEKNDELDLSFTFSTIDTSVLQGNEIADSGTYSIKIKLVDKEDWIDTQLSIFVV